jgi:hypothetical protein
MMAAGVKPAVLRLAQSTQSEQLPLTLALSAEVLRGQAQFRRRTRLKIATSAIRLMIDVYRIPIFCNSQPACQCFLCANSSRARLQFRFGAACTANACYKTWPVGEAGSRVSRGESDAAGAPLGGGFDGGVWALEVFDHNLIAGGGFATIDGHVSTYMATWACTYARGDLNCDGLLNAFDIDPFVPALTNPEGYASAWPDCDYMLADVNGDGAVNIFDIDPFVLLLTGG